MLRFLGNLFRLFGISKKRNGQHPGGNVEFPLEQRSARWRRFKTYSSFAKEMGRLVRQNVPQDILVAFLNEMQRLEPMYEIFDFVKKRHLLAVFTGPLLAALDVSLFRKCVKGMSFHPYCFDVYIRALNSSQLPVERKKMLLDEVKQEDCEALKRCLFPESGKGATPGIGIFLREIFDGINFRLNPYAGRHSDFIFRISRASVRLEDEDLGCIPEMLAEAVRQDDVPRFKIVRTLCDFHDRECVFNFAFNCQAGKIVSMLMRETPDLLERCQTVSSSDAERPPQCRSLAEWAFLALRYSHSTFTVSFLKALEKGHPGTLATARDPWGNTLLWYAGLYENQYTRRVRELLLKCGCDPHVPNRYGISPSMSESWTQTVK